LTDLKKRVVRNSHEYSLGIALITFRTKREARETLKVWDNESAHGLERIFRKVNGLKRKVYWSGTSGVSVAKAPEPNDIIWMNLGTSNYVKFLRRCATLGVSMITLGISFGTTFGMKYIQHKVIGRNIRTDDVIYRIASLPVSIIIVSINIIISRLQRKLTLAEKHSSETEHFDSLTVKETMAQFVNTCLVVIIVHFMISDRVDEIYSSGGLIEDICFILLSQIFIQPLFNAIGVWDLLRAFRRYRLTRDLEAHHKVAVTQDEANEIFEMGAFDPAYVYSTFGNLFLACLFFQPILPIASYSTLIALILNYIAYKKKLLRDSKRPVMLTGKIAEKMLMIISWGPFVHSVDSINPRYRQ
jgi:hypothetical protein